MDWVGFSLRTALFEHIAEERTLFNCIIERHVRMRQLVEPVLWHVFLRAFSVVRFQHGHGK